MCHIETYDQIMHIMQETERFKAESQILTK